MAALNLSTHDTYKYPREVEWQIDQNNNEQYIEVAKEINNDPNITEVIIQHEYGIFGGNKGDKILHFMRACKKPMLVTLHTVLPSPRSKMREVTREIIKFASTIVVLTNSSRVIIEKLYPESRGKIFVIPHGIHPTSFSSQKRYKAKLKLTNHIVLSTFGLLSPGKGIEYVIRSLPPVIKKHPSLVYLILGETHPVVRREFGEEYRLKLSALVKKLNLGKHVKFYDQYLSLEDLFEFLKATDIYISTSINPNQAVSGTLSYALGTGRPVISTEFAQAKEIITKETGRLVPIKDSRHFTSALIDLLRDPRTLKRMSKTAYEKTRPMLWSKVAEEYLISLTKTTKPTINLDHLIEMTDDFGLFQFASFTKANKKFGYTLDDNARALIVCSWLLKKNKSKKIEDLVQIYFNFIKRCYQQDGFFINYIDFKDKKPTEQNEREDLDDANSRSLWALSEIMTNNKVDLTVRTEAKELFLKVFKRRDKFRHIRAKAQAIKAFTVALPFLPEYKPQLVYAIKEYADSLCFAIKENSDDSWIWFESFLQYNNGILPESLFNASKVLKNKYYEERAISTLNFLISKTFISNTYRPIGNSKWYRKGEERSEFDQQPEEPASTILALVRAYKNTHSEVYKNLAKICFSWFLGNNILKMSIYDQISGGVYDGLRANGVNLNEGAESVVSFLMSNILIHNLK